MADDAPAPIEDPRIDISWEARKLLRAARQGSLATTSAGQPFVSLATPAIAPDGAILLLLSDLSEHTRHLRGDPRCSVLVTGPANGPNPQTMPRLTVTATAAISDTGPDRARFLAIHPYAELYAGFGDFHLWRLTLTGGLFIGGFAVAHRLRANELVPGATLGDAEAGILAHCNDDHAPAMAAIARAAGGAPGEWLRGEWRPGEWRMVTCDTDGFDLAAPETTRRIAFAAPVADPNGVRAELIRLARSRPDDGLDPLPATP